MVCESAHRVRLDSAPGTYTVTSRWIGLEGTEDDVCNKYELSVDDEDVTVTYEFTIPERGRVLRPRLSVRDLGRGFYEMLESALTDERLLARLSGLDISADSISTMMAELKVKYEL